MENYKISFFFSQFDKYLLSVCCVQDSAGILGRLRKGAEV